MIQILLIFVVLVLSPLNSQNIEGLQSVRTMDFADLPADMVVESGWFTLSPDGQSIAVVRRDGGLVIYDSTDGDIADTFTVTGDNGQPATVLDARFHPDNQRQLLATINTDGEAFYAVVHTVGGETERYNIPFEYGIPLRVWFDDRDANLWIETTNLAGDSFDVLYLPLPEAESQDFFTLPSGPENDAESFVRIGRIPAPLAVTSTQDGSVKLWDLETGEVTQEVELGAVPVFGRVNETTGQQLAWRDPESQTLQVLDFETGENTLVAELGGDYIQALMLTPLADVVLAVHIGDEPVVAAWDVASGERLNLGEYRACNRVPDMVQLSIDGTTLVIGCDTGLDVWQVVE